MLLTSTRIAREGYEGRIVVNDFHVTLSAVTGADEGSYTVRDAKGDIERKVCLNIRGEKLNSRYFLSASRSTPSITMVFHLSTSTYFPVMAFKALMDSCRIMHFTCSRLCVRLRAPALCDPSVWEKTEDQPDTQRVLGPPLLHPRLRRHNPAADGQGRVYKCNCSFFCFFSPNKSH